MAEPLTFRRLREVLNAIAYKDWHFDIGQLGRGCYLRVLFYEGGRRWAGRKWYVSRHACRSEIVQTALKAVLTAEEHEAREKFLYRGVPIFGPHKDVDALVAVTDDVRSGAPGGDH